MQLASPAVYSALTPHNCYYSLTSRASLTAETSDAGSGTEKGRALQLHQEGISSVECWVEHGCFDKIFEASVSRLFAGKMLDISVLHCDGTCTTAKKGAII